jgi:uncharacterized protein (TIGR02246 family)
MPLDPSTLRAFAKRYTTAWCNHDPSQVASFFSPSGSLTVNDTPPAIGRDAITEVARSFMTAFPDLRVTMDDLRVHAKHADYHWTLTGANTGPGGAGRKVRISGFERWQFAPDGLIAISHGHFDDADYRRQLAPE